MLRLMTQAEFSSFDGVRLSYSVEGDGRPVVMLHGLFANSRLNWVEPGVTAALTGAGFKAIMLDHRGHGRSAAPEEADAYPTDVLARDAEALIAHLKLQDFDLLGYSLGARTAIRMLARGVRPRRCVLGGMGDSGVAGSATRVAFFQEVLTKGESSASPEAARRALALIERSQVKPRAMLPLLRSQVQTPAADLREVDTPILVVCGDRDDDNGSAEGLAKFFPHARALRTPGNHLSAVGKPEFAAAIVQFLTAP